MRLPSLAERIDELGFLIATLLARHAELEYKQPTINVEAMRALLQHPWPLNIRELEHLISSAITPSQTRIEVEHLPSTIRAPSSLVAMPRRETPRMTASEREEHRGMLVGLIAKHGGSIHAVARELGKDRVQIRRWIKCYEIDPARFRS
jgi:DNA-binding NtrC family response regulator